MGPISVTVVDANNITLEVTPTPTTVVEIDRGVAGNGIVSIVPVTISTLQYLRITYTNGTVSDVGPLTSTAYFGQSPIDIVGNTISLSTVPVQLGGTGATTASGALSNLGGIGTITSTDGSITVTPAGTTVNLAVSEASPASTLLTPVRNTTGATLAKGTVVYISGATGQIATVSKALASSDATSAQTLGMITSDLPNNTNGYVTVFGLILDIDTSAYADGAQLYLSGVTAGAVTATKPSAPTHLVYVAVVEYSHAVHGKLLVKVQNGYELDELHNVSITSPATGQTIIYNSGTGLWSNSTVSLTAGVNGTLPIANGGTGQTTANAAFNALAPSQTGNSGKYLTTDGTNTSWATNPLGTVTSVGGTGTVSGITLSGTVTTSGNLTLGGALDLSAYNGAGAFTTLSASGAVTLSGGTANGVAYLNGSKALTTGSALTFDGSSMVLNTSTSSDALRITQTGTGNALLVEDSTNPDSTPFVVDTIGRAIIGTTTAISTVAITTSVTPNFQQHGTTLSTSSVGLFSWGSNPYYTFNKAGAGGVGTYTTVASGDVLGRIQFNGANGTNFICGAIISSEVDGAPGTNDMPGRLVFSTTADGASTPTERMRLDSSGNLGIGVTPSAWGSGYKALQVNGASLMASSSYAQLGVNNYWNGTNDIYIASLAASYYVQSAGAHKWFNAPSGTAGTAISFTQAMTLDASGNLGIGTSSPGAKLTIENGHVNMTTDYGARWRAAGAGAYNGAMLFDSGNNWIVQLGSSLTEAMRLTSTGLGIGTSSPVTKLHVVDASNTFSAAFKGAGGTNIVAIGTTSSGASIAGYTAGFAAAADLVLQPNGGNLGLGVTPSAWNADYKNFAIGTGGEFYGRVSTTEVGYGSNYYRNSGGSYIYLTSAAASYQAQVGGVHYWFTAPSGTAGNAISFTQAMTLTAGGFLALGTTAPNAILTTAPRQGAVPTNNSVLNGLSLFNDQDNVTGDGVQIFFDHSFRTPGTQARGAFIRSTSISNYSTGVNLLFGTGLADTLSTKMTLDAYGNLGLGVTPSVGYGKEFSISGDTNAGVGGLGIRNLDTANNVTYLSNNAKNTGAFSDSYWVSNLATKYQQDTGGHKWFISTGTPSAGSTITFNQAMTLTADGRLLINDTSGESAARIFASGAPSSSGDTNIVLYDSVAAKSVRLLRTGSAYNYAGMGASESALYTANSNLNIVADGGGGVIKFNTGSAASERARITSSGFFLVNTTSSGYQNANCQSLEGSVGYGVFSHVDGTASGTLYIAFGYGGNGIGSITQNGTTSVAYNTSSDYRLKEDIQPMTGALAKVAALKPCTYKWKADGSDGEGFIAHELAEVVPQCVTGEKDAVDAEGKPVYQGIDTSFLVATLTAAIQELKAEFDAYKATHP